MNKSLFDKLHSKKEYCPCSVCAYLGRERITYRRRKRRRMRQDLRAETGQAMWDVREERALGLL